MGALPFSERADVLAQGGALVAVVGSSPAWPSSSSNTRGGKAFDHRAQVELAALEHVTPANRKLRIAGVVYAIVDHEAAEFLPHVELSLRIVRG